MPNACAGQPPPVVGVIPFALQSVSGGPGVGVPDVGVPDVGVPDVGVPDVGGPCDAGPCDAGTGEQEGPEYPGEQLLH